MKKNIIFISLSIICVAVYFFTLYSLVKEDYSFEYRLYFIEKETQYWGGEETLSVSETNQTINFFQEEGTPNFYVQPKTLCNLNRIDRNWNVKINEDKMVTSIETNKTADIYYSLEEEHLPYNIVIKFLNNEKLNEIDISVNNQIITKEVIDNTLKISGIGYEEQNCLTIIPNNNTINILSVEFELN